MGGLLVRIQPKVIFFFQKTNLINVEVQKRQTLSFSKSQDGFIKILDVVITHVSAQLVFESIILPQVGDREHIYMPKAPKK